VPVYGKPDAAKGEALTHAVGAWWLDTMGEQCDARVTECAGA